MLFSALVVLSSLGLVEHARAAGADSIADLKAQATTVSEQLVQQELEVGAYQQQYSVLSARVAADSQAIAQTDAQIAADQQQISAKTDAVRHQAINSYMNYGTGGSSAVGTMFNGSQETVQAASEYTSIAVGNITSAVDELHTAETSLEAHESALRQQQTQDQADQSRQSTALDQANSTATHLASLQGQVTGQLAAAVAAQQAAEAAAATSAVAAATHTSQATRPRRHRETRPGRRPGRARPLRPAVAATPRSIRSSNAWSKPSQAATTVPSRPTACTWVPSSSASPRGTVRGAGCRSSRSDRRPSQSGLQGRPGHAGGRPLFARRRPAVAGGPL